MPGAGSTGRLRQQDLSVSPRLDDHPSGLLCADLRGAFRGLEPVVSRRTGRVGAHANSRQGVGAAAVASGQEDSGPDLNRKEKRKRESIEKLLLNSAAYLASQRSAADAPWLQVLQLSSTFMCVCV